ncbi:MAG: hypothetical protein SFV54_14555 [Bryobacteraceae bacterium]|nr:hypothetical protein [Bryobacteraceae bacterium]
MKLLLVAVVTAGIAAAQGPMRGLPPELVRFLQLTPEQTATVVRNNSRLVTFNLEKARRMAEVQRELAFETRKDVLDPLALGVRYVEIESICRELRQQQEETRKANVAALADAQRTRMAALDEALRLLPVISQAQAANLMTGQVGALASVGSLLPGDSTSFVSAAVCRPVPAAIIRNPLPLE